MAERKHWGHFGSPWGFASPGAASSILCTAKPQEHTGQKTQAGMSLGLQDEVGDVQLPRDAERSRTGKCCPQGPGTFWVLAFPMVNYDDELMAS